MMNQPLDGTDDARPFVREAIVDPEKGGDLAEENQHTRAADQSDDHASADVADHVAHARGCESELDQTFEKCQCEDELKVCSGTRVRRDHPMDRRGDEEALRICRPRREMMTAAEEGADDALDDRSVDPVDGRNA